MTTYLKFQDEDAAITALATAGYTMDDYNAHCSGDGWGPVFAIPDTEGHFCNLYDCNNLPETLQQYVVPAPLTPYNCRAGEIVETVYRCVVVTAEVRDLCRSMVVQLAGPTHADMWSTALSADGSAPATHYINSGLVRVELAATLSSASALSSAAGIPIEMAEGLLAQAHVSSASEADVLELLQLKPVQE